MKVLSVVGARPNFMKVAPIIAAIERHNDGADEPIRHVLVHTGQHYDAAMSDVFFRELGIPAPDGLNVRGILESSQLARLLQKILLESPRLSWVKLFPYGTPFPEMFEIDVHLGSIRQGPSQVALGQG